MAFKHTAVTTFDISNERRDFDVAPQIERYLTKNGLNKFAALLMKLTKKVTKSKRFTWFDSMNDVWQTQINNDGGYNTEADELKVDDASIFAPKDLLYCGRVDEVMFVNEVNLDTNTVTVIRNYGGNSSGAGVLQNDDYVIRLGNAMEENSLAPQSKILQPDEFYNYTQILRTPFDESETDAAEDKETNESERKRLRQDKAIAHTLDMERIVLFGQRKEDNVHKRHLTGGLRYFINSNVTNVNGILTENTLVNNILPNVWKYQGGDRFLIGSMFLMGVINNWAGDRIKTNSGDKSYGMDLQYLITPWGRLYLVHSHALDGYFADWGFIVNLKALKLRPLKGRDTKLRTNIQENDRDGWKDEYKTEFGVEVRLEKTHGIIYGVTG